VVVTAAVLVPTIGVWGRVAWSAGALVPALLTHRWIERRVRAARGDADGETDWWPATAAVAGCMAVALVAGVLQRSAERRAWAPDQRALAAARIDRVPHACWANAGTVEPSRACVFGDPHAATTVALFGDSHAEHWLAALDRLGHERGWRVVVMVKGGCPVADTPELIAPSSVRRGRECARYREAVIRRLIALRPTVAVLSSYDEYVRRDGAAADARGTGGHVSPDAWRRGLTRTYGRLAAAGVPVIAMRGTPHAGFDVPACLSRQADRTPHALPCEYEREAALHATARSAQLAAVRDVATRGLPVRAVDMADRVCATSPCSVVRDGRVVFSDDNHLTASFTRASAGVLGARLDDAARALGVRLP
jgi:hypothetical protein